MMPPKSVLETPQMVYHAIVPILPIKNSILFLFLLKMPATGKVLSNHTRQVQEKGKYTLIHSVAILQLWVSADLVLQMPPAG